MTISAASTEFAYAGDGVTLAFAIPFPFDTAADIKVTQADSSGAITVVTTGFSISGGAGSTGTLTYVVAPAVGITVTILDDLAFTQDHDYTANDPFPAESHERALDRVTRLAKRLKSIVDRCLRAADGDTVLSFFLPSKVNRAGQYLSFDSSGNPVAASGTGNDSALRTDLANTATAGKGNELVGWRRTATEIANNIVPTDYTVPHHEAVGSYDLARYGITGTAADVSSNIQAIVNMVNAAGGGTIRVRKPTIDYYLGTAAVGLTVPARVKLYGDNEDAVQFRYAGTGLGIDVLGSTNQLQNIYLKTTAAAANGIRFGANSRRAQITQITTQCTYTPASGRTGIGFLFKTYTTDTTFSGDFDGRNMYSLGYKYGAKTECFEIAAKTWTSLCFSKLFLVGPGAGVVAGSIGFWGDALSNLIGSYVHVGTIEGYEVPIQIDSGEGVGINYRGDIEGNTSDNPSLPASASCEIVAQNAGKFYRRGSNGTANRWYAEQHLNGVWDRETLYTQSWLIYDFSGDARFFDFYRGASKIDGGSPQRKFRMAVGNSGADNGANRNYLEMSFAGNVVHTAGTGSPEGAVTGACGSTYGQSNGAAGNTRWKKDTGTGNVGWVVS